LSECLDSVGWDNIIANDPDDDYNLVTELWYNGINCGVLKWDRIEGKYNLIIYPNKDNFIVPCDMLKKILDNLDSLQVTRNV